MHILAITFDFSSWQYAKSWSYISSYLLIDELRGIDQAECDLLVMESNWSCESNYRLLRKKLQSTQYDMILLWLPHIRINNDTAQLLAEHCQVIYIVTESLVYTKKECELLPHLSFRWEEAVSLNTQNAIYVCLCPITYRKLIANDYKAIFTYGFIPHQLIDIPKNKGSFYSFSANLYNQHRIYLAGKARAILSNLQMSAIDIKDSASLTREFDVRINELTNLVKSDQYIDMDDIMRLSNEILEIRKKIWRDYLLQISLCRIVLSLPSYFKGLPGRIIESLIINVPIGVLETNLTRKEILDLKGLNGLNFFSIHSLKKTILTISGPSLSNIKQLQLFFLTSTDLLSKIKNYKNEVPTSQKNNFWSRWVRHEK